MSSTDRPMSRGMIVLVVSALSAATLAAVEHHRHHNQLAASRLTHSPIPILDVSGPSASGHAPVVAAAPAMPARQLTPSIDGGVIETNTPTGNSAVDPLATATPNAVNVPAGPNAAVTTPEGPGPGRGNAWTQLLATGAAAPMLAAVASTDATPTGTSNSPSPLQPARLAGATPVNPAALPSAGMMPPTTVAGTVDDAKRLQAAGQLLQARAIFNANLQTGTLPPDQAQAIKAAIAQINQTVVFSKQLFPQDDYGGTYVVRPRDSLVKIAAANATTWDLLSAINQLDPRRLRAGATIKLLRGPTFAVVTKHAYTMDFYLQALPGQSGSMYLTSFPVGLGRDDSTPTGTWQIGPHAKLKHPRYYPPQGGAPIDADDPKNPLGGYWIALTGVGGQAIGKHSYGVHGTIDPDSIGHQSSMGCIRLRHDDIALVYTLLVEGKSQVVVNP